MTYLLRIYVLYTYKRVLYVYMCTTHIYVFYTYICILVIICTEYLEQQKKWIEGRTATNLGMGYCKDLNGRRTQGLYRDYIDLSAAIEEAGISEHHATKFIDVVKSVTQKHGTNIAIPSEYRNLKRAVLKQVEGRLLPIKCELLPYPKSLFDCSDTMKRMPLVHVDLMLVVADIMLHLAETGIYVI